MIRFLGICLCGLIVVLTFASNASAHEVRPGALTLTEKEDNVFLVLWKQPALSDKRLKLEPVLPEACEVLSPEIEWVSGGSYLKEQTVRCNMREGIIGVDGLTLTITDVLLQIAYLDGETRTHLFKPHAAFMDLTEETPGIAAFFQLGIDHIIFGYDHLLFVLALLLLIERRQILWVITSFTLAHSITLSLSALGGWSLPQSPIEILIALSLVLMAFEAAQKFKGHGEDSLVRRQPHLISFGFGLIHGFGFAGALKEIGLPAGDEIWALALFNLGVEAGQIAIVILASVSFLLLWKLQKSWALAGKFIGIYVVGIIGMFWSLERLLV